VAYVLNGLPLGRRETRRSSKGRGKARWSTGVIQIDKTRSGRGRIRRPAAATEPYISIVRW